MHLNDAVFFDPSKRIEDIEGLWWAKGDTGSWDGPSADWHSHRVEIVGRVPSHGVVVQAGGNMGLYANLLSKTFDTVYTFEPDPLNFYVLALNTTVDNVIKFNAALGEDNRLISMDEISSYNRGEMRVNRDSGGIIPTLTIDQLNLPRCDLIWLDIERSEEYAIRGAVQTIDRCRPVVALELPNEATVEFLEGMGYSMVGYSISDRVFASTN